MGEWVIGAFINLFGTIAINFGTNLLKFGHNEVLDALRTTIFILGMMSVFLGISLLAPEEPRDGEFKDNSSLVSRTSTSFSAEEERLVVSTKELETGDARSFSQGFLLKITDVTAKAKASLTLPLGFGEESLNASAVLVMPMVSLRITGFRGTGFERSKFFSMRKPDWSKISLDEDPKVLGTNIGFSQNL